MACGNLVARSFRTVAAWHVPSGLVSEAAHVRKAAAHVSKTAAVSEAVKHRGRTQKKPTARGFPRTAGKSPPIGGGKSGAAGRKTWTGRATALATRLVQAYPKN